MTQFQQDVWKILLDKLALVIVAGVLGLYFNKLLEKHKARIGFDQKLTDRKLDALERLGLILQKQLFKIQYLVILLEHGPGPDPQKSEKSFNRAYNKFAVEFHERMPRALQIVALYFPAPMGDMFQAHQETVRQFNILLTGTVPVTSAIPELRQLANKMFRSTADLQIAVREEMKKPPF